ncbi:MAG: NAD(P)-dependent glycerol-3-phosphate dehydrogenase [Chloroflexi bacterium]|nr:NAD(P)-dependent glycerol-3-phosphate dehydrogenase [Chloroflexota bacterium]MCL5075889.1 NAD(P)-dependent glycerol-3-phosphate dehydrogenase [Chloroflexota bacterium]
MKGITIIGTGTWGTTLAIFLARKGLPVQLWCRTAEEATILEKEGENKTFLPSVMFPEGLRVTASLDDACSDCWFLLLIVPAQTMRANVRRLRDRLNSSTLILSGAKGLEYDTGMRMTEVITSELPAQFQGRIAALSGPNLAREIAMGLPATTVVACHDQGVADCMQSVLMDPLLRVYTNTDVIGVELGGALKNIIALGAGICDGFGYGDNAKAAFITRGLAEISRLGIAAGANPLTFAGLTGLGDLVCTCASPYSRNRYVGQELAKGRKISDILSSMRMVAEGVQTTVAARRLSQRYGVEMPITELTYQVLFEGKDPRKAVGELMGRGPKQELYGLESS